MDDVMIFEPATTTPFRQVTNAERAVVEGQTLRLLNARVTRFKRTGEVDGFAIQKDLDVGLPVGETVDQFFNATTNDPYTVNSTQLRGQIKAMQATGQGGSALDVLKITLAHQELSLAPQLGKKGRNLGVAMGIALSILLLFVYYLMMSACSALGKNEALNPYLAVWLPNVIMGAAGAVMFRRVDH